MKQPTKFTVERRTAPRVHRIAAEIAELKAVRGQFQREKPSLDDVLAATGRSEAIPLGKYLQTAATPLLIRAQKAQPI